MRRTLRRTVTLCWIVLSVSLALAPPAAAADKADPTGTWKGKFERPDGQATEFTFKLKLEGDKLTGTMTGRDNKETPIEEAKFKDGEVAFQVSRERGGQKFTVKYTGKLDGDKLKGKMSAKFAEQDFTLDWEAMREKK